MKSINSESPKENLSEFLNSKLSRYDIHVESKYKCNTEDENIKGRHITNILMKEVKIFDIAISEIWSDILIVKLVSKELTRVAWDSYISDSRRTYKGLGTYIVYLILVYCMRYKKAIKIAPISAGAQEYWNRFGLSYAEDPKNFYHGNYKTLGFFRIYIGLLFSFSNFIFLRRRN